MRRYWIMLVEVAIVLVPSYTAAYLTGEMVWVVPTLVVSGILAAGVGSRGTTTRLDEDGDGVTATGMKKMMVTSWANTQTAANQHPDD